MTLRKVTLSEHDLRRFIKKHPSLKDVPINIVDGKPISLLDARGLGKAIFSFPSDEEIWELAIEYCLRICTKNPERKLFLMTKEGAVELSVIDRIEHLTRRTDIGKVLHRMYKTFLVQIFRWMEEVASRR